MIYFPDTPILVQEPGLGVHYDLHTSLGARLQ